MYSSSTAVKKPVSVPPSTMRRPPSKSSRNSSDSSPCSSRRLACLHFTRPRSAEAFMAADAFLSRVACFPIQKKMVCVSPRLRAPSLGSSVERKMKQSPDNKLPPVLSILNGAGEKFSMRQTVNPGSEPTLSPNVPLWSTSSRDKKSPTQLSRAGAEAPNPECPPTAAASPASRSARLALSSVFDKSGSFTRPSKIALLAALSLCAAFLSGVKLLVGVAHSPSTSRTLLRAAGAPASREKSA
mmetsp:Transcript_1866/g.4696  ORF Transcript_1866/g.4696 Transcript_1866/m.4696 type:complete len:242 (-) Transcript_1866:220-945(-)